MKKRREKRKTRRSFERFRRVLILQFLKKWANFVCKTFAKSCKTFAISAKEKQLFSRLKVLDLLRF